MSDPGVCRGSRKSGLSDKKIDSVILWSTAGCQHDCTCFSKSISKTITNYFTVAFTCVCPSLSGAQGIDNVLPDILAVLCRVLCSQSKIWRCWDIRWLKTDKLCTQKGEIHEVCVVKFKKSEWTFFSLEENIVCLKRNKTNCSFIFHSC